MYGKISVKNVTKTLDGRLYCGACFKIELKQTKLEEGEEEL
jgi:hypothetical protein